MVYMSRCISKIINIFQSQQIKYSPIWFESNTENTNEQTSTTSSASENKEIESEETGISKITGAIIGAGDGLLSGWQLVTVFALLAGMFIAFVVSRTMLKMKDRN